MRLILDTNFYLSAFAFDSKIEELYRQLISDTSNEIYFSPETIKELDEKFTFSSISKLIQKSKRNLNRSQCSAFVSELRELTTLVETQYVVTICRDDSDNKFLELAKTVQADYLITGDKDLLVLKEFEGCKILKPGEFLLQIESNNLLLN
jgi:putative PIN family toxin of toxin-antitoxin system